MIVEAELAKLKRFQSYLTFEDKLIFDDLIVSCKRYAPYASTMVYTIKEVPLIISMLFGQQKRLAALEKRVMTLETIIKKTQSAHNDIPVQDTSAINQAVVEGSLSQSYGEAVFEATDSPAT
jgi:hypothetical protein